jgi:uncharacterized protein
MARPASASKKPRAWQRMLSGRRLDLLDPSPFDIEIDDIAQGLARVARWNGQTKGDHAFSVAEHSVIVEALCGELQPDWPAKWRLAALLHDAPEYVIGDMISPFKAALGYDYKAFEHRLETAIHARFGLPGELPKTVHKTIKQADRISAFFEAVDIAGFSVEEARQFFDAPPPGLRVEINPRPAAEAQQLFLERFADLIDDMENRSRRVAGRRI